MNESIDMMVARIEEGVTVLERQRDEAVALLDAKEKECEELRRELEVARIALEEEKKRG